MTKTNDTTQDIIKAINKLGGFAKRVNVVGIRNRKATNTGHPDITGIYKGLGFMVEVKTGKDVLRDSQKDFIYEYTIAGGKVFIVSSCNDFLNEFLNWINKAA